MLAYADTSFLVSLVLPESGTASAVEFLRSRREGLPFTPLHRIEFRTAIRLAVHHKGLSRERAREALDQNARDLKSRDLIEVSPSWSQVVERADELGERYSFEFGMRTLDLLHLSTALCMDAREMVTLDKRLRACAEKSGLRVRP
jgi:predicted nucleic acid-binding protein